MGSFPAKRDQTHVLSRLQIFWYSKSLKCPLHNASYALRICFLRTENLSICHGAVRLWICNSSYFSTQVLHFYCAYCDTFLFAETIPYIIVIIIIFMQYVLSHNFAKHECLKYAVDHFKWFMQSNHFIAWIITIVHDSDSVWIAPQVENFLESFLFLQLYVAFYIIATMN